MKEAILITFFAIVVLLLGCTGNLRPMDCPIVAPISVAQIKWIAVDDPYIECANRGAITFERGGACIACEIIDKTQKCTMWGPKVNEIDDVILGHEVKHAFGCKHTNEK